MTWDPTLYLKFGSDRLRPALDLLARVGLQAPKVVVDLGCGAGNVTQALRARWPDARQTHIIGVDSSPEMLARAAKTEPSAEWVQADISTWTPEAPVDLVFSNAALHWLPGHEKLFPRLMNFVKPGGELAVQMPNQTSAPSHTGIAESIDAAPWRARRVLRLARAPGAARRPVGDAVYPCAGRRVARLFGGGRVDPEHRAQTADECDGRAGPGLVLVRLLPAHEPGLPAARRRHHAVSVPSIVHGGAEEVSAPARPTD